MFKSGIQRPLVALAVAGLLSACASGTALPPQSVSGSPGGQLFNGYAKEGVNCTRCHNGDGTGRNGLKGLVPKMSDAQLLHKIDDGSEATFGLMPAFKDKLTSDEKAQLVSWLRTQFPSRP